MEPPARQLPHQPRVHRAESDLAGRGAPPQLRVLVEQPCDLRAGEVGIKHQAGPLTEQRAEAGLLQRSAVRRRAPALPDNRRRHRPAGRPLPQNRRLALVGDTDGGETALPPHPGRSAPPPAPRPSRPAPSPRAVPGRAPPSQGRGYACRTAAVPRPTIAPARSTTSTVVAVVPWSIARI